MPIDYGLFTFLSSEPSGSRYSREYGVQARGHVFRQHFEYRLGVFQGHREPNSTNPFRYAGRAVWYPFEAETGFFYIGTKLGTKRVIAVGVGFDHQMDYDSRSVDVFVDQPLRAGDGLTFQAGYTHLDGGTALSQLPPEHAWLLEAGYYNERTRLGPFLQFAGRFPDEGYRQVPGRTCIPDRRARPEPEAGTGAQQRQRTAGKMAHRAPGTAPRLSATPDRTQFMGSGAPPLRVLSLQNP